jgi:hypothetical protein
VQLGELLLVSSCSCSRDIQGMSCGTSSGVLLVLPVCVMHVLI